MKNKAFDEDTEKVAITAPLLKSGRLYLVVLQLSLIVLYGCGTDVVYRDNFDSSPIGELPGPPQIGTSSVFGDPGDVLIAENPINDI